MIGIVVAIGGTILAVAFENSAFIVVALVSGGVGDSTLIDLNDLSAVLGTAANEATNTNYARKTLANGALTITVDDTNDRA